MSNMQFAIINKNHFIIMFVKRYKSHVKPGRKDNQIYVPHPQRSLHTDYPPIKSVEMAHFYYNELSRYGYISPTPAPVPSQGNVYLSTVTAMSDVKLEPQNDGSLLFVGNVDTTAIQPLPDPSGTYKIYFYSASNLTFAVNSQTLYYFECPQIDQGTNTMQQIYTLKQTSPASLKLDFAICWFKVVTDAPSVRYYVTTQDEKSYILPDHVYIDLSDAETNILLLFIKQ